MPRYICLIQGINVGGHGKLAMTELRHLIQSLGYTKVQTLIQSGNVVFSSAHTVTSASIESALEQEFGLSVPVFLRTPAELKRVLAANPFPRADTASLHIGFLSGKPQAATVRELDTDRFAPEKAAIKGSEIYYHLPNGMGRAKLPPYITRRLDMPITVRNWNTVTSLLEISQS